MHFPGIYGVVNGNVLVLQPHYVWMSWQVVTKQTKAMKTIIMV